MLTTSDCSRPRYLSQLYPALLITDSRLLDVPQPFHSRDKAWVGSVMCQWQVFHDSSQAFRFRFWISGRCSFTLNGRWSWRPSRPYISLRAFLPSFPSDWRSRCPPINSTKFHSHDLSQSWSSQWRYVQPRQSPLRLHDGPWILAPLSVCLSTDHWCAEAWSPTLHVSTVNSTTTHMQSWHLPVRTDSNTQLKFSVIIFTTACYYLHIRDVFTCFKFGDDRFRGLASAEGQILPSPIDFDGRLYKTHTTVRACDRPNYCAVFRLWHARFTFVFHKRNFLERISKQTSCYYLQCYFEIKKSPED